MNVASMKREDVFNLISGALSDAEKVLDSIVSDNAKAELRENTSLLFLGAVAKKYLYHFGKRSGMEKMLEKCKTSNWKNGNQPYLSNAIKYYHFYVKYGIELGTIAGQRAYRKLFTLVSIGSKGETDFKKSKHEAKFASVVNGKHTHKSPETNQETVTTVSTLIESDSIFESLFGERKPFKLNWSTGQFDKMQESKAQAALESWVATLVKDKRELATMLKKACDKHIVGIVKPTMKKQKQKKADEILADK